MKYTITGGSGFIGMEIVKRLLKQGHEVTIADVREPREEELKKYFKFCDITDPFQVQDVVKGRDVVIHLAANSDPGLAEKNPRFDLRLNVDGVLNVIDACKCFKVRMVFSSTAAIIYSPLSCYAITKRTAEKYILHNIDQGLNASILRFWNVYGPTQGLGFVVPDLIDKLRKNPDEVHIRGTGLDLRDFVYIDDVVDAIILVAEKGVVGQTYEVGSGEQITIYDLARTIGNMMNGKVPQVIPAKQVKEQSKTILPENLELLHSLGWRAQYNIADGVKKMVNT